MECDENGRKRPVSASAGSRELKRQRRVGGEGVVQLADPAAVPGASHERPVRGEGVPPCAQNLPSSRADNPFMNNMDEISYWIYTKRAPCLFNYDNIFKKQVEQAQCSNTKAASIKNKNEEEPTPKKKRKLKLMEDDSASTEKQQNIYFKTPQNQKATFTSCKSDTLVSDIDFNIKHSSVQKKSQKMKLQRNCQKIVHKKSKVVTSTPKVVNLRRSLRKAQQNLNNNSHLNSSFEIFNSGIINGKQEIMELQEDSKAEKPAKTVEVKAKVVIMPEKGKNKVSNGQFEDLSDVSGFTANYIRSTKIHLSKAPQKIKNQNSRTLIKPSQQRVQQDKMIVCINKSMNTGFSDPAALNCSTDSSQNALNLVTVKNNERSTRVDKSTSLLKFVGTKVENNVPKNKINKQESKNKLNISFQSRSSVQQVSRYPRRHKTNAAGTEQNCTAMNNSKMNTSSKKCNVTKRKVNSGEKIITRSGKKLGLILGESSCSGLHSNNSLEHVSSSPALNVASPNNKLTNRNNSSRCLRSKTSRNKCQLVYKDSDSDESHEKNHTNMHLVLEETSKGVKQVKKSLDKIGQSLSRDTTSRDKTGFAACFSDSDSDFEPLKQKFFS